MSRPASSWRILIVCALMAATGCHPTQPFYLHEDGDLSHYLDKAVQTETPDLDAHPLAEVEYAEKPLTLSNPEFKEFWDLTLEECVSICLNNSKVLRGGTSARLQNGQLVAGTQEGSLVTNSLGRIFATSYDAAIVESNPGIQQFNLFGQPTTDGPSVDGGSGGVRQGVEAALADFDAQLSISGTPGSQIFSSTDRPQNVVPNIFGFPTVTDLRTGGGQVQLSKRAATGTQYFLRSTTEYDRGNQRGQVQALNSTWTQGVEVEVRHPLLRGGGVQINRMPIVLARIGTDIELMSMQAQLQDTLNNLEIRYWDLYLAYRNLETAKVGRDSALVTWRIVYDKWQNEVEPIQAEAQAREQYFAFRAQVETALRELYNAENELRLIMGLSATDGRLMRPKDDPTLALVQYDWYEILAEAIARRPELNQQRWRLKQREMELILARNRLLPQLDVGAFYRWLGIGDDLINADRNGLDFPAAGSTAWEELTGGKYQEAGLLFSYQMPIGFRRELAGVRHAQLLIARDKALLEEMELDISHGLTKAVRNLDANFQLAQTNANRWAASQREVEAMEALYRGGRVALNDVLEAQRRRAQGQAAFWSAVTEYNKSISDLHTRKGSILDYNHIGFEEGPWPQKAYWDALARARERDAGTYIDYGWTRPKVISRGAAPSGGVTEGIQIEAMPGEVIESPEPTPAARPPMGSEDELPMPAPQPIETRAMPRQPVIGQSPAVGTGVVQAAAIAEIEPAPPASKPSEVRVPAAQEATAPLAKPADPPVSRVIESSAGNPLRGAVRR
ncbi:MAG: TolC family protein [Pirellulaceae bacterium]|nr:TolC family protein [Pirellulaceae bacterium]